MEQNTREKLKERTSVNQEAVKSNDNEQLETLDDVTVMKDDWFSRSPAENVKLLNEEAEMTGVYGFGYYKDSYPDDIPGMNMVIYELPGDKNGGRYIGYESYEQTYAREKEAYEKNLKEGTMTSQAEMTYQEASSQYRNQKEAYKAYRKDYPGSPDYLKEKDPVGAYRKYDTSLRQMEARQRMNEAEPGISMQDANLHMAKGETVFLADVASDKKKTVASVTKKEPVREPLQYVVRQEGDLDKNAVNGIQSYLSRSNVSFSKVSAKDDPDAYGASVIEQMKQMDESLKKTDPSYKSEFPENLRYYKEGENPIGIPGMTLVVGQIEGAPGFYAGYESYDSTYRKALQKADASAEKLERERTKGSLGASELTAKTDENRQQYTNANEIYDFQKQQYLSYVKKHPGNDFLSKSDAVQSYQKYQSSVLDAKEQDAITNIKGLLVNGWNGLVSNLDKFSKKVTAVVQKVMHPEMAELKDAAEKQAQSLEYVDKTKDVVSAEQTSVSKQTASTGKNVFKQIVQQNTRQPDRTEDMPKTAGLKDTFVSRYSGLTGVAMLDQLNRDEDDVLVNRLLNSVEAAEETARDGKSSLSSTTRKTVEAVAEVAEGKEQNFGRKDKGRKESSMTSKSTRLEKLAALDAQLAAGAAKSQEEELSLQTG